MAKKKAEPADRRPTDGALTIEGDPARSGDRRRADMMVQGVAGNALIAKVYAAAGNMPDSGGLQECYDAVKETVAKVKDGGLELADELLAAQAVSLNGIYIELARRAALNIGQYPEAFERYMRLAMKAQSQCRCTLESLSEIKNPRQAVFARQANIAGGHQQVNNGVAVPMNTSAHESEGVLPQNKLLEVESNVTRLEPRATGKARRGDPPLEAVGAVHRASKRGRKAAGQP